MRQPIIYSFIILLSCMPFLTAHAQEQAGLRERAEQYLEEYNYAQAIPLYLKLMGKKPDLIDMERLAFSYLMTDQYDEARKWYEIVIQNPGSSAENLLTYGSVLKNTGDYTKAKEILMQYAEVTGEKTRVAHEIAGCDSALAWIATPTAHVIRNEHGVNTPNAEFSAVNIAGTIYYTGEPSEASGLYGRTGNPYLKLFSASQAENNGLTDPHELSEAYNQSQYHVGPIAASSSGDELYVTRTYIGREGDIVKSNGRKYRTHKLELYVYHKEGDQWVETPFPYNDVKKYSIGHATLSPGDSILYFVSDNPVGEGGTDIWYCKRLADGGWGLPVNAGKVINSSGNEMFPVMAPDGTLYFSSDGFVGMGALDIYKSTGEKFRWSVPQNLRYPLNSAGDDFGFTITSFSQEGVSGYLSSNRGGGEGNDDIYSFTRAILVNLAVQGIAYDKSSGKTLPGVSFTLRRQIGADSNHPSDSTFFFELEKETPYQILARKSGYVPDSAGITTVGIAGSDTLFVALYLKPLFEVGQKLAVENLYYDFDRYNIREDAAKILNKLVQTMKQYPTLQIELSSHTDCRGSDAYNLNLSQQRAQAAVDYLINHGISRDRMTAKGYGENRLVNKCSDNVPCTAAEHQANRRTEVTVVDF